MREKKQAKLFLAFPVYNAVDPVFFQCYTKFVQEIDEQNIETGLLIQCGDSLVSRQRNSMTNQFMTETDFDYMMFIDTDLVFSAKQVRKIYDNMSKPGIDICAGLYPKKTPHVLDWVINGLDNPSKAKKRKDTLAEIKYAGTGFLCVKRKVFESIKKKFGDEIRYTNDSSRKKEYDYWRVGVCKFKGNEARYLSEDWYFCEMAKRCGYKVYVDQAVVVKHHGMIMYPTPEQEKLLNLNGVAVPSAPSENGSGGRVKPPVPVQRKD